MDQINYAQNLRQGDIILTRRYDEEQNWNPGYWNHAALVSPTKEFTKDHSYAEWGSKAPHQRTPSPIRITEAVGEHGVIQNSWLAWLETGVEHWIHLTPKRRWHNHAIKAAWFAPSLLGTPYRYVPGLFRGLRWWQKLHPGLNCIGVVRLCYEDGLGRDPKWVWPDHIVTCGMFEIVDMP